MVHYKRKKKQIKRFKNLAYFYSVWSRYPNMHAYCSLAANTRKESKHTAYNQELCYNYSKTY